MSRRPRRLRGLHFCSYSWNLCGDESGALREWRGGCLRSSFGCFSIDVWKSFWKSVVGLWLMLRRRCLEDSRCCSSSQSWQKIVGRLGGRFRFDSLLRGTRSSCVFSPLIIVLCVYNTPMPYISKNQHTRGL